MESVFETLVEDNPEEESTLTSKMQMGSCACASVCEQARVNIQVCLGEVMALVLG